MLQHESRFAGSKVISIQLNVPPINVGCNGLDRIIFLVIIFLTLLVRGRQPVTLVGGVGCGARGSGLVSRATREASGHRPLPLRGAARKGWTGQDERGESPGIGRAKSPLSESRKYGPEAQNRRGEAPEGVRAALKRAPCRKARTIEVLRLPALHPLGFAGWDGMDGAPGAVNPGSDDARAASVAARSCAAIVRAPFIKRDTTCPT